MDKNTSAAEGTGTSHRDAASLAMPQDTRPGMTRNAILDGNHSQSVEGCSSARARPALSVPEEIKNQDDQTEKKRPSLREMGRAALDMGKALSKKPLKMTLNPRKGNQATSTTESPTHPSVSSPGTEQSASDAHHPPQLPQFHAQHTPEDQPVEEDKTDQEDHYSQEGSAEESETLASDDEDEDEGQDRPQLSNLARYFWSRLDVAYQYYVEDRDDDCREVILETLPRGMVPIACRCELLQLLACVMPWEQAQDCLNEADELCQEMEILAPYSQRVTELRTKGYNIRGALREYHELANESSSTSDDEEMDDLAERLQEDLLV